MLQYIEEIAALVVTVLSGIVAGFWITRSKVVKSLAQSNKDLAEQLDLMSRSLENLRSKYVALQDENTEIRRRIAEIDIRNKLLSERVGELEAENRRLHGELATLRRENKRLIEQNEAMLAGVRKLVSQIKNLGQTPAWEPPTHKPEDNKDQL